MKTRVSVGKSRKEKKKGKKNSVDVLFQVSYCTAVMYRIICVVASVACPACQSKQAHS